MSIDINKAQQYINQVWDDTITPSLVEYIKIPNKSPLFDKDWQANGYMDDAVKLMVKWVSDFLPGDATLKVVQEEGRTPLIYIDIPGSSDSTVLLYGHLDKQPEMTGWRDDLGPWKPVIEEGKLYGRGGADDGYAIYASLTAINALKEQGVPHSRAVILIEGSEESGSVDLPFYVDMLKDEIGEPELVICLDSGSGNYEQLWMTTSLRGNLVCDLSVDITREGAHSGNASGIVADSFRLIRQLLSRIESEDTGEVLLKALQVPIPEVRIEQARSTANVLGDLVYDGFSFVDGAKPVSPDKVELILNRTWRAMLAITGQAGLPDIADAGNVLRPSTELKLSLRTPPVCNMEEAIAELQERLTANPPYGAKVTVTDIDGASGWHAPVFTPWLVDACQKASQSIFGLDAQYMGEGGTIPFMGMLGEKFPNAQFMITGVLGPESNAHGPNEFLHLTMAKKLTACVSSVLAKQHEMLG